MTAIPWRDLCSGTIRTFSHSGSIACLSAVLALVTFSPTIAHQNEPFEFSRTGLSADCKVAFTKDAETLQVEWPAEGEQVCRMTFDLKAAKPLVRSISIRRNASAPFQLLAESLDPLCTVRVGKRDLEKRDGWTIFFDRMQNKPSQVHETQLERQFASATGTESRAELVFGNVQAGPFGGKLRWSFFAGSSFVLQEYLLTTETDGVAYLYDAGVSSRLVPAGLSWRQAADRQLASYSTSQESEARHVAVHGRAVAASFEAGSLVLFPPPHRFFYPLDFSDNLKNVWFDRRAEQLRWGLRHDPKGDNRFVPWFNAPPDSEQELGLFWFLAPESAPDALDKVAKLTRDDRFDALPGHTVFSSHYHVEHTREILNASREDDAKAIEAPLPSGGAYRIPERLRNPGFARVLREMGIDVVHLAEFHFGRTPRMGLEERMRYLEILHAECDRLSDDDFLLLPGEEPNVHLGGHWISLFPRPVNWVLNRPPKSEVVSTHPRYGKVYQVGSAADVLHLLREEGGLAWTAHPRIKGSTGFPDRYRQELFFESDRFLGAAWKAMPGDLSSPRLGSRVLDLLDDMWNWGHAKYVLGEVDVFKIEPDHELFGHMNVNYLRLSQTPRFEEGWQSILDTLRNGEFFVTTGEVLIPGFSVNGLQSGGSAQVTDGEARVQLKLEWTFPLEFVELVMGDGETVTRKRISMRDTGTHGKETYEWKVNVSGQKWLRAEVWDIATNGAFSQPVHLQQ